MVGGQFQLKGGIFLLDWAECTKMRNWELDIVTWPGELPEWVRECLGHPAAEDRISRSRLAGDPPDVMVAPRLGHVGYLEFYRAEECIAAGEEAARRALPEIHEAMRVLGAGTAAWNRKAKAASDASKSADNVSV